MSPYFNPRRYSPKIALLFAALLSLTLLSVPSARAAEPIWGAGVRLGNFGIPDFILDEFLDEHPGVNGTLVGGEFRYYGDGGPGGVFSLALAADVGRADADGVWRKEESDEPTTARGRFTLVAATVTALWDFYPEAPLHPFVGLGVGYGRLSGSYAEEGAPEVRVRENLPILHIPVGLVLRLGHHFTLRAEARFLDALSLGGHFMLNF